MDEYEQKYRLHVMHEGPEVIGIEYTLKERDTFMGAVSTSDAATAVLWIPTVQGDVFVIPWARVSALKWEFIETKKE